MALTLAGRVDRISLADCAPLSQAMLNTRYYHPIGQRTLGANAANSNSSTTTTTTTNNNNNSDTDSSAERRQRPGTGHSPAAYQHPLAGPASPGQISRQKLLKRLAALKTNEPGNGSSNNNSGNAKGSTSTSVINAKSGLATAMAAARQTQPMRRRLSPQTAVAGPFASPIKVNSNASSNAGDRRPNALDHSAMSLTRPTSFEDSCTALANLCGNVLPSQNFSNIHLQNLQSCHRVLQRDLQGVSDTAAALRMEATGLRADLEKTRAALSSHIQDKQLLQKELALLRKAAVNTDDTETTELHSRLAQTQDELKTALETLHKEQSNVEFLQTFMEELIAGRDKAETERTRLEAEKTQLKDEKAELKAEKTKLEDEVLAFKTAATSLSDASEADGAETIEQLRADRTRLQETLKLLELERDSSKSVCQKAIEVLDRREVSEQAAGLATELEETRTALAAKLAEIEKLHSREKHFRESNEIFQQKLMLLSEENRRLRGQRPSPY